MLRKVANWSQSFFCRPTSGSTPKITASLLAHAYHVWTTSIEGFCELSCLHTKTTTERTNDRQTATITQLCLGGV